MQNNVSKNIRWGVILSYVSLIVSLLGALFISNRVLHYIGDYNYGLYTFVSSITSWLTVLSSALIASYLRFAAIDNSEHHNADRVNTLFFKILSTLGLGIILAGCSVIAALYLSRVRFGAYSWEESVMIYALFVLSILNIGATFIIAVFSQYINYKKSFIYDKSLAICLSVLNFAGHYVIARFTGNVILLSAFSLVTTAITFLCNYTFCRRKLQMRFTDLQLKQEKPYIKKILIFSSVLVLNSIVDQINANVDKTLLGFFSIPENITMYQMGQLFQSYLASVVTAVSGVFAPSIHDLCAHGDEDGVNALFLRISKLQAMIVCFVAFAFVSCGKHFIFWWLGESYTAAFHVGAVLMLLSIMPLSVKLAIEVQRARNLHRFRSYLFFAVAILNVLLSILFLVIFEDKYAVYACLLGTIISNILCQWIAMNIYNAKKIKLPIRKHLLQVAKFSAFGVFCLLVTKLLGNKISSIYILEHIKLFFIEGASYTTVFAALLLIFERKYIISFLKRR